MSDCYPHFYCTECSNVIHRIKDKGPLFTGCSQEKLDRIESTLPKCSCGGKFKGGNNPKCPNCNFEFKHQGDPVSRLADPHMILINGAVLFDENGSKYQLKIT